ARARPVQSQRSMARPHLIGVASFTRGKGPSRCGPGQVSRAGLTSRYSALPLCVTGRAKHPLVALIPSPDLFISAKYLFVEAIMASPHTWADGLFKAVWQRTQRRPTQGMLREPAPPTECRMQCLPTSQGSSKEPDR